MNKSSFSIICFLWALLSPAIANPIQTLVVKIPGGHRSGIGIKFLDQAKGKPMMGGVEYPARKNGWDKIVLQKLPNNILKVMEREENSLTLNFKTSFRLLKSTDLLSIPDRTSVIIGYISIDGKEQPIRLILESDRKDKQKHPKKNRANKSQHPTASS
ncbi:hypothetical protein HW115_19330 [Verrucomicrobiaceae bacterium N1E253]|uniref:Uncharacterized protein n=1 Tax=Oceaniferula marina TaxID=2748318 RepID=A0A851GSM0_9BACT|nr:hypothetical protein [Oceaniferula marina]NWK57780.1 hypothetical protein [Oceaniferula marina]